MLQLTEIMKRANAQYVCNFIINDCTDSPVEHLTYQKRLDQTHQDMLGLLKDRLPYDKYNDDLKDQMYLTLGDYSDIYIAVGIKAGAKLMAQLLIEGE